jgi:leucyl aminopeptidase (aminopeptidase T)
VSDTSATPTMPDHPLSATSQLARAEALAKVADIAVRQCAGVRPGERLLVLTDTAGDPQLADLIAAAGRAQGAETLLISMPWAPTIHDIPPRVQEAVAASDVVIPVCRSRILYSSTIRNIPKTGRCLYMADVPTENFLRPVVLEADYQQLARYAEVFERIFSVDGELTVRTKAGTNATMTMRGHVPLSISSCRSHHKGDHDYLPGGAWFGCPIEESVNGTFVIDSSMEPGVAGGILTEPVVLTFRDGVLVDIDGGAQAREFEAWLDSCDDQIRGVAHNGGGFNAAAQRVGNLMEDERILGAFNIAGGNNQSGWPGKNSSSYHWDAMMLNATYSYNGVPICEDGVFVHPDLVAVAEG